jgi:putative transposase
MQGRKHIRLREFDYSSVNAYFITICVFNHRCVFGEIRNGIMGLSDLGNHAAFCMQEIPQRRPHVLLDEFIVMPNHVHCILDIKTGDISLERCNQFSKSIAGSVSIMINQFKGAVTTWAKKNGYDDFCWQGKFHDHVIRDDKEYRLIKNYIINNPGNWAKDKFFL